MASLDIYCFRFLILLTLVGTSTTYALPRNPLAPLTISSDTFSFPQPTSTDITQIPSISIAAEPGTFGVSLYASGHPLSVAIILCLRQSEYTHKPRNRRKSIIATIRHHHGNFPDNPVLYFWRRRHPSSVHSKHPSRNGYASTTFGRRRLLHRCVSSDRHVSSAKPNLIS